MKRAMVFIDGYASDHKGFFEVEDDVTREAMEAEARTRYGSFARVYAVIDLPSTDDYGMILPNRYEREAIDWLAQVPGDDTENRIHVAQDAYFETISDAGRHWQHCTFTADRLQTINRELAKLYIAANSKWAERYREAFKGDNT